MPNKERSVTRPMTEQVIEPAPPYGDERQPQSSLVAVVAWILPPLALITMLMAFGLDTIPG